MLQRYFYQGQYTDVVKFKMIYIHAIPGADPGGAPGARPPLKLEKNKIFWRKIVIFHTKYPNIFALPPLGAIFLSAPPP